MRGGEKSGERVGSKKELNTNGLQRHVAVANVTIAPDVL